MTDTIDRLLASHPEVAERRAIQAEGTNVKQGPFTKKIPTQDDPPARTWNLSDLYVAEMPKVEGSLGNHMLIPESVNMLVGDFGSGKTWLGLSLARSICLGMPWGILNTLPSPVMYLSEEMVEFEIADRIRQLYTPEDVQLMKGRFFIRFRDQFDLASADSCRQLRKIVSDSCPAGSLVIGDSFSDFHHSDENSNNEMKVVMGNLRDLVARPAESPFLMLHHTSKPSEFRRGAHRSRGAAVVSDRSAVVMVIEKDGSGGRRIEFDKTRHGAPPQPMAYKIAQDAGRVRLQFDALSEETGAGYELSEARRLAEWIQTEGPKNKDEMGSKFGWKKRTVEKYLSILTQTGRVERDPTFPGNRGHFYRISQPNLHGE